MKNGQIDKSHICLTYITHFYCNQQNIDSVTSLLKHYESYDSSLLDVIEFIIIDDGSPVNYSVSKYNLNLTWLKINEDISWNQAGARNLGIVYAKSDRVLMTDLDHVFPEKTLRYLAYRKHPGRKLFKVRRQYSQIGEHLPTWNIFYLSRARFLRFYGYDEAFTGRYGFEDLWLSRFHKYRGSKQCYLPKRYPCFEREVDREKSYHSLMRDMSENHKLYDKKKREFKDYGQEFGHTRIFLNFTWQIFSYQYRKTPKKPKKKHWNLWWMRHLSHYFAL